MNFAVRLEIHLVMEFPFPVEIDSEYCVASVRKEAESHLKRWVASIGRADGGGVAESTVCPHLSRTGIAWPWSWRKEEFRSISLRPADWRNG